MFVNLNLKSEYLELLCSSCMANLRLFIFTMMGTIAFVTLSALAHAPPAILVKDWIQFSIKLNYGLDQNKNNI